MSSIWTGAASSSWSTAGNWTGSVPNAQDAVAEFPGGATSFNITTGNVNLTVGTLTFSNTSGTSYGITINVAGRSLTFSSSTDSALLQMTNANISSATIGNTAITNGLTLGSDLVIKNDSSVNLTLPRIAGSKSITINGSGSGLVIFSPVGTSTYSGGTILTAGTLSVGLNTSLATGALIFSSGSTGVFNVSTGFTTTRTITLTGNGTFDVNLGQTLTISTVAGITGAGGLIKTGSGQVTLTTANSYTGDTTVSAGTLQGDSSSLPTNIYNAATLVFNQTSNGTFSKTIDQSGSTYGDVTVQGGGTLTQTGTWTQNAVTVTGTGILAANGSITCTAPSSGMTINAGGVLKGTGTIYSEVLNYGTVKPGNSIGTITIQGNYTQESGSTLEIEFGPTSADKLIVQGNFTMGSNTTLSLLPDVGSYSPLTSYIIVQASGGITPFTTVTNSTPAFSYQLHTHPMYIRLLINIVPFASIVSGDALLVAHCLDAVSPPDGDDLGFVIESLQVMGGLEMEKTMLQMLPTLFNGLDLDQETILLQVRNTLSREMNLFCKNECLKSHSWRVWSDFFRNNSSQDNVGTKAGYKGQPLGEVVGADRWIRENIFVGGSVAYAQDNLTWHRGFGKALLQGGYSSVYAGGWLLPNLYCQGALVGALNHYVTHRSIDFTAAQDQYATFQRVARGSFFGYSLLPHLETGCSFIQNHLRTKAFAKADYAFVHRTAFQEDEADSLDLQVKSHSADLLRFELGIELLRCIPIRGVTLSPYLSFGGVFENRFIGQTETASLVGLRCPMEPAGIFPDRRLFFLETGIMHEFIPDLAFLGADFRGEWQKDYTTLTWSVQARVAF